MQAVASKAAEHASEESNNFHSMVMQHDQLQELYKKVCWIKSSSSACCSLAPIVFGHAEIDVTVHLVSFRHSIATMVQNQCMATN